MLNAISQHACQNGQPTPDSKPTPECHKISLFRLDMRFVDILQDRLGVDERFAATLKEA